MTDFHDGLMQVMSISSLEEEEVEEAPKEEGKPSVFTVIMKTLKDQPLKEEQDEQHIKSPEEKFRKVMVETIIRWGSESEIENQSETKLASQSEKSKTKCLILHQKVLKAKMKKSGPHLSSERIPKVQN